MQSHLLQEGQRQHAPPLNVVSVLHTYEARAWVVRVRVPVADLCLQLFEVKRPIRTGGHRGGVDPCQLHTLQ